MNAQQQLQQAISAQMRRAFKKEIRLVRAHRAGQHQRPENTCDLCMKRLSNLGKRVDEFKNKTRQQIEELAHG